MKEGIIIFKCIDDKELENVADKIEGFLDNLICDRKLEEYNFFRQWGSLDLKSQKQEGENNG